MNWLVTIDLIDIWNKYPSDEITDGDKFLEVRDEVVKRLRAKKDEIEKFPSVSMFEFDSIIDCLEITEDMDEFNDYWSQLYDWADDHGVWIATMFTGLVQK